MYSPAAFVVAVRVDAGNVRRSSTVAPGTGSPSASTTPRTVPDDPPEKSMFAVIADWPACSVPDVVGDVAPW